jgi:hypothetical protein
MKTKCSLILAVVVLVMATLACDASSLPFFPTPTPLPTYTPQPTYTLQPTYTPVPTATLIPTFTPLPQILGIDLPVSVLDVDFTFFTVAITDVPTNNGANLMTPNAGYSVLIASAYYTGDISALFNGSYQGSGVLYIDDGVYAMNDWSSVSWSNFIVYIGFYVKTEANSYILHNTVGQAWSIDLGNLIP